MSSWSASAYPPPPRRSRSRSPLRGPYPPRASYPDPAYPPDQYRDWDAYDRDRMWAAYERDRNPNYEYGRRGRSRSPPPPEEFNRKRRRSPSPYDRERYDPRPRYDDHDTHSRGGYGYASPPRRGHPAPFPPSRRAPPDPHTFDYPASLKQYAEWFRFFYPQQAIEEDNADKAAEQEAADGSKPRNGIKSKWDKYKKDFAASQLQTMFEHHRKSPWFAEKYDPAPEFQQLRMRVRKEGWKGRIDTFLLDLESGKFDPDLNESDSSETTSQVKEGAANGNPPPAEESKPAPTTSADDDMQFNMEVEDDGGDNEAGANRAEANGKPFADVDPKRPSRGEEVSVPPEGNQVMIRTIPPDIGRVKLEEACGKVPGFMYLALGDPLQKRNYYRAGWLRFRDDADMSAVMTELTEKKIEGFKLHVTHNVRPFVNRIRYAPEVASKPDRLRKDLANAKALAAILEEEAAVLRRAKVGTSAKREDDIDGKGTDEVVMDSLEDGEPEPEPREKGSDAIDRRVEKVMSDLRDQGLIDVNNEAAYEAKKTVVSLDLYIAYLRAAFHTCYYCSLVTDHLEELQRKCLKHARIPLSKEQLEEIKAAEAEKAEKEKTGAVKAEDLEDKDTMMIVDKDKDKRDVQGKDNRNWKRNDDRWLDWLDSKIALLINRDGVDPRDYGGKSYDEELTKAVEPYIKQEDEGKFRCKTCQKLFKATSFVEKHIANKHSELVRYLDDLPYFNNFALDPHRIQPFAHPPTAVGNGQAPPPQAYGIQGPPAYHGPGEYPRQGGYYGGGGGGGSSSSYSQGGFPPPYSGGGHWDHHGYTGSGGYGAGGPPSYPPPIPAPPRRDESTTARRLSDRISGYAPGMETPQGLPAGAGLPAKPVSALDSALSSGSNTGRRGGRNGGGGGMGGPLPPPPPDAKEDPRAAAGKRVSYHDMDLVAEGDVELTY